MFQPAGPFLRVERDNGLILHANISPEIVLGAALVRVPESLFDSRNGRQCEYEADNTHATDSLRYRIDGSVDAGTARENLTGNVTVVAGAKSFTRLTRNQTVPQYLEMRAQRIGGGTAPTIVAHELGKGPG